MPPHLPPDGHAFHPSEWPLVEAFQAGFLALGAGRSGLVTLDSPTATCPACSVHLVFDVRIGEWRREK